MLARDMGFFRPRALQPLSWKYILVCRAVSPLGSASAIAFNDRTLDYPLPFSLEHL